MNELALFAGAGGGILGGHLLGWRTVCAVEFDTYAAGVIISRQDDGTLPPFPIWNDIRTFDGRPWAGLVDVISGGFPCQDISCAGKGAGIDGERSGLWGEMFRVVREVGPRFVFVENSPMLTSRGLGRVLGDLASVGYDAEWLVLGADDVGAPHRRERIWILAHACADGRLDGSGSKSSSANQRGQVTRSWRGVQESPGLRRGMVNPNSHPAQGLVAGAQQGELRRPAGLHDRAGGEPSQGWWEAEPHMGRMVDGLAAGLDIHGTHAGIDVGRVANGVPNRVGRLKAIGNGQVPICAANAFLTLRKRFTK